MDATTVMRHLTAKGLTLRADADRLIVFPSERLSEGDRALIREHRAELMAFIEQASVTTSTLLALAMQVCDSYGDGPEARAQMRKDCLDTPLHLQQDLIDHFQSQVKGEGS